jgi:hypothetical protein
VVATDVTLLPPADERLRGVLARAGAALPVEPVAAVADQQAPGLTVGVAAVPSTGPATTAPGSQRELTLRPESIVQLYLLHIGERERRRPRQAVRSARQ